MVDSKASAYRQKAKSLRDLAEILQRSSASIELLAEAAKWDRLAEAVEKADRARDKPDA